MTDTVRFRKGATIIHEGTTGSNAYLNEQFDLLPDRIQDAGIEINVFIIIPAFGGSEHVRVILESLVEISSLDCNLLAHPK